MDELKNKYRVIIWGYPMKEPIANTVSYVWNGIYKAFKILGFETYWFSDENYPKDFDFSNCIFWAEGYADDNLPLNDTSIYYVHCAWNPKKYIGHVKKFIDIRYNLRYIEHPNYIYKLDKENTPQLGKGCYYEKSTNQIVDFKNGRVRYDIEDFDKLYLSWATNLMPHEIDENDIYKKRNKIVYFLGTLSTDGQYANVNLIQEFENECKKNGIDFS